MNFELITIYIAQTVHSMYNSFNFKLSIAAIICIYAEKGFLRTGVHIFFIGEGADVYDIMTSKKASLQNPYAGEGGIENFLNNCFLLTKTWGSF